MKILGLVKKQDLNFISADVEIKENYEIIFAKEDSNRKKVCLGKPLGCLPKKGIEI